MTQFHVGQKVVCVDVERRPAGNKVPRDKAESVGAKFPEKGNVYTIRELYLSNKGTPGVLLEEIENVYASFSLGFSSEIGFDADRFRPVIERKTSIEIFQAMLITPKVGIPA